MILLSDGIVLHFLAIDLNQSHDSVLSSVPSLFPSACMHAKSLQSSPILCDPMDHSPPGSSACGIFQARKLERSAMQGLTGGLNPAVLGLLHWQASPVLLVSLGKPSGC